MSVLAEERVAVLPAPALGDERREEVEALGPRRRAGCARNRGNTGDMRRGAVPQAATTASRHQAVTALLLAL